MVKMKCYAKTYCKAYETDKCNERCDFWWKLNALYESSQIPIRYRHNIPLRPEQVDRQSFEFLRDFTEDVVRHITEGNSVYIYSSTTGNGKTTWATKIANQYIRKIVSTSLLEDEVLYLNVSLFLDQLKSQFNGYSEEIAELQERAKNCKLLILDDIGAERPSEYVCERLYDLINYRYTNMLSTIYTSNLNPMELGDRLGMRIESRIKSAYQVKLVGSDRRTV